MSLGKNWVAIQHGQALGVCRRAGGRCRQLGARARGATGARVCGAGGGRRAGRERGARQAGRRIGARDRQALGVRGAHGLGAGASLGLCTWCTRPVFVPVRLGIFRSQIFGTLFVNSVHEHCSSQNFSEKKIFIKFK